MKALFIRLDCALCRENPAWCMVVIVTTIIIIIIVKG